MIERPWPGPPWSMPLVPGWRDLVFDVALLPGLRYPEIAEEGSDAATNAFVLPEAQPAAG